MFYPGVTFYIDKMLLQMFFINECSPTLDQSEITGTSEATFVCTFSETAVSFSGDSCHCQYASTEFILPHFILHVNVKFIPSTALQRQSSANGTLGACEYYCSMSLMSLQLRFYLTVKSIKGTKSRMCLVTLPLIEPFVLRCEAAFGL